MPFNQGGMQGGMQGMQGGMEGGMFGPSGGPQNLGGSVMTDQELQKLLGQMGQMQAPRGGSDVASLPIYDMPAQLPQGTPSLGTTGIDPTMIASAPPAPPMDFGVQDIAGGMQGTQEGLMNIGRQRAQEERLKRLFAMSGGAVVPPGIGATPPPMNAPAGGAFSPQIPMNRFPR
jgi:hypothetical protein